MDVLKNPIVMGILKVSLILFASHLSFKLPKKVEELFSNRLFQIVFLALMLITVEIDLQMAVIIAVIYALVLEYLTKLEPFTQFDPNKPVPEEYKQRLIIPQIHIHPGCANVTRQDLIDLFSNDRLKLQKTVMYAFKSLIDNATDIKDIERLKMIATAAGLPNNVNFDDDKNLPFIATLLLYSGFIVNDTCKFN